MCWVVARKTPVPPIPVLQAARRLSQLCRTFISEALSGPHCEQLCGLLAGRRPICKAGGLLASKQAGPKQGVKKVISHTDQLERRPNLPHAWTSQRPLHSHLHNFAYKQANHISDTIIQDFLGHRVAFCDIIETSAFETWRQVSWELLILERQSFVVAVVLLVKKESVWC